jgi:lipoate-protein ligase A
MDSRSLYVGKMTEMRLPRHDTSLRLPAEAPVEGLLRDEALLDDVLDQGKTLVRWWLPASPAVVVGLGLRHRLKEVVDVGRCRQHGLEVLDRRAGGGALLLDGHMLCGAICLPLPDPRIGDDITESYRWLGDLLASVLAARRVEVAEARADVATLRAQPEDPVARTLLATCYGALSPHEVAIGSAKLVGIAQVRRRQAALFQFGILLRDQSPLADYLNVPDEATRDGLRAELRARTAAVEPTGPAAAAVAAAVEDAMPCVP